MLFGDRYLGPYHCHDSLHAGLPQFFPAYANAGKGMEIHVQKAQYFLDYLLL